MINKTIFEILGLQIIKPICFWNFGLNFKLKRACCVPMPPPVDRQDDRQRGRKTSGPGRGRGAGPGRGRAAPKRGGRGRK